jgi:hypothetical protein
MEFDPAANPQEQRRPASRLEPVLAGEGDRDPPRRPGGEI